MGVIKVALLQMTSYGEDQSANERKGEEFCRNASKIGADIALFPEMWNIGYSPSYLNKIKPWWEWAINQENNFVIHFQELARELQLIISLTYLERSGNTLRDVVSIIDR